MTPSTEPSDDGLAFVQRRVGLFGLFTGALVLVFFPLRLLAEEYESILGEPCLMSHLGAGLTLVSMWFALRTKVSARWTRVVEISGLILASTLLVVMGTYIPVHAHPEKIVVMSLGFVHIARAIYVPSSARRTSLIAVTTGAIIAIVIFASSRQIDPKVYAAFAPQIAALSPMQFAMMCAVAATAWWALFGALAIAGSKVIYGLRKQVGSIKKLGQYHIEAELGAGAMGIVYRAHHALLRRETAVKVLGPERTGEAALQRFEREVKLTAQLKHPNTVTVYDYGRTPEGMFYYAMELLDGETLEQMVESSGPFLPQRVIHILKHAAGALAEAHELGLVHRDIKPANIMLCNQGGEFDVVKVLDFGLVKEVKSEGPQLTQINSLTGTPLYMAPEAFTTPEAIDGRSDLYALGAVAYYLLVGDHVFRANSLIEMCTKHLHETPTAPSARSRHTIPKELDSIVLECLEKLPEKRPQSARELLKKLAQIPSQAWDTAQAEAWWRERTSGVRQLERPKVGMSQTIELDLNLRRAL